jgi:hypothetical protein
MTRPVSPSKRLAPIQSVREQIAAGPKFEHHADTHCLGCQVFDSTDRVTGLCVTRCWPAWRWSPVRERLNPSASE